MTSHGRLQAKHVVATGLIMNENLDLLKSLGLNSSTFSNQSSIVDAETQTHPKLRSAKIDIANIGTLKKQEAVVTVSRGEKAKFGTSIYEEYILEPKSKGFLAETEVSIPFIGQLSFYNPSKEDNSLEGNNYFNPFVAEAKNPNNIYFKGLNPTLPYARFSFSNLDLANSNVLNGFSYKTGKYNAITTNNVSNIFTGKSVAIYSKNFSIWNKNKLPGENQTQALNNFYLSFPNTISVWNYNAFNVPIKLAPYMNYGENADLNGIILISTGSNNNEKICYISPHKAGTGLFNTIVYANNAKTITRFNGNLLSSPSTINSKFPTGIILKTILVGSEYLNSGKCFPTGIRLRYSGESQITNTYSLQDYTKNKIPSNQFSPKEWNHPYKIDSNSHLRQDTPIKDTAYYEMYSGLYNASKTFNTGTWNGIIPPGVPFKIELVSCLYNNKIGTDTIIYPIYSGYGTFDSTDLKIYESLTAFNLNSGEEYINGTKVRISDGKNILSIGRGRGKDSSEAYKAAKENVKYILFSKFSNIIKNNIPDILYANKKLRKFLKYLRTKKNKFTNLSVSASTNAISTASVIVDTPTLGLPPLPDSFIEDLGYSYVSFNEFYDETTGIGNSVKFYDTLQTKTITTKDGDVNTNIYYDQSNQYALWATSYLDDIRWYITKISDFQANQLGDGYFYVDSNRFWSDYLMEVQLNGGGVWDGSAIRIKLKPSREILRSTSFTNQTLPDAQVITDPADYESIWKLFNPTENAPAVDLISNSIYFARTRASVLSLRLRDLGGKNLSITSITTANVTSNIRYIFAVFPKTEWEVINGEPVV